MQLFFDLDGTLTDPGEGIVNGLIHAIEQMGFYPENTDLLKKYIGLPLEDIFRDYFEHPTEKFTSECVVHYKIFYNNVGWLQNNIYPGIAEALRQLRDDGHTCRVCTAKRSNIAKQIINHFALNQYFADVSGCDNQVSKSELLSRLIRDNRLDRQECLMLGDRFIDMKAGKDNNIVSIGVLWGFGSKKELSRSGADYLIDMPGKLKTLLSNLSF